ncbi:DoxX-like family protein [Dokdonella sp.]|uniref:DoxX-like family protein n=1 Tax=Dokdonella sp. TaxID=2291710 RepID=UPI003C4BD1E3
MWLYHGVVPKLLGPHEDELAMTMAAGLSHANAVHVANVTGVLEILMAIAVLVFWRQRWPLLTTALAMVGLLLAVVVMQPVLLSGAFNPVTTNLSVLALSVVALQLYTMRETSV